MTLLVMAIFIKGCSQENQDTDITLALDWFPNANHIGLYIAEDKGYFKDEGLNVEIRTPSDPSAILQTVASGTDDFGINYQPDLLIARDAGIPVISILGMVQHPLNSVMTLHSSGYTSLSDLKNKKIGYPGIPWNEDALNTMLKSDGLSGIDDIELVNVSWELGTSLMSEKVDAVIGAYFTHESISLENQGYPVDIFRMEDWGVPDYYELILVTSEMYLKNNPKIVEGFTRAVTKGYRDAIQDPQLGVDVLKKYSPDIDESIDRPGADLLQKLWIDSNGGFGKQTYNKWNNFGNWMKSNDIISKDLDIDDAYTDVYFSK
jgi:putative hydroxymethylpyrimidine transport system substrate-binding protein